MRIILQLAVFALALVLLPGCGGNRSQVLKVYNWYNYINPDVIPEFEAWYRQQTGETIKVEYKEFETNNELWSALEAGGDYDVIAPSDYMIERMLKYGMLQPINRDFGHAPNYLTDDNVSPFIREHFAMLSDTLDANQYAVGNNWGTTGILYNAEYVTDNDAYTWNILRNFKYRDRILIKDAARDVYSQVILAVKGKEIAEGKVTPDELMYYTGEENLAEVEQFLMNVHEIVHSWDAVEDKEKMIHEEGYVNLNWNGEAVMAIEEAAQAGVTLRFALPEEGYTIWFDGWAIPKNAVNPKAASYFINYMLKPDVVIRNSEVTGYVASCSSLEVLNHFIDDKYPVSDLSYFFGPEAGAVRVNPVMFPDKKDVARSYIEHDWGENTYKLDEMWARVIAKEGSFPWLPVLFSLVAVSAFFFVRTRKKV